MKTPAAGDLIEIDVGNGRQPALVVSIDRFQDSGFALICPVSSHSPATGLEVAVPEGFAVAGSILSHQVKTVDWKARGYAFLDHLPRATLLHVRARLKLFLGI